MKKRTRTVFVLAALLSGLYACHTSPEAGQGFTRYVDPYIGTGDHGHVFLGANTPYGFVQLGPTQIVHGWDWTSGYHYSDSVIVGFGHQHLSGTGIGDLGDISLMPVIGEVITTAVIPAADGTLPDPRTGLYSLFSHERETVRPGYYAVHLDRDGIDVELTATPRTGFHKYTFPETDDARIVIDLEKGIGWDAPVEGYLVQENDTVVSGYRFSKGWAKDQRVYFTAVFSRPIKEFILSDSTARVEGNSITAQKPYGQALMGNVGNEPVFVKVALSPVSIDNAKLNLRQELPGWDFEGTMAAADRAWNDQLGRVVAETKDTTALKVFYTALYHSMTAPSVFCDLNGDYRGSDGKIYNDTTFTNYTTLSLWDTYRAAHPLMTIIHPDMCADMATTMINIYRQQGKLPVWHLMGNETDCMVGNPGIPVLADLFLKGFVADSATAYEAMKNSALLDERGLGLLKQYGYLPWNLEPTFETVAKGMEYALADWCVGQVANKMGNTEDYVYFDNRSKSYRYYFDPATRFMRGVSAEGKFHEPFNPFASTHREDDYTEGNAWQYTWLVPQDVYGLIGLFGNEEAFVSKLDSLFVVQGDLGKDASPDISGLIGQYAHGNEPSHHVPYLYAYAGQPWKTAEKVREVLTTLYHAAPAGLCGNEDVGQMSSWYVLSAMGFYQVEPAGGIYVFGSPLMDRITLNVGEGKTFTIVALANTPKNVYIQNVKLNGKPYRKSYIRYADIMEGGELEFEMGPKPSRTFGTDPANRPVYE